jgi:hypothetical protein
MNQPNKTVSWQGVDYDPVQVFRGNQHPPADFLGNFQAQHGGDLGAPINEGFYWFVKYTGTEL